MTAMSLDLLLLQVINVDFARVLKRWTGFVHWIIIYATQDPLKRRKTIRKTN